MANITDQFVTSFSELHINAATVSTQLLVILLFVISLLVEVSSAALVVTLGSAITLVAAEPTLLEVTDTTGTKFVLSYTTAAVAEATYSDIAAFVAVTAVSFHSAQVPLVMEIGTLSNEATVIDTPTFGELYRGKLRGQLDGGQLDSQLYWAPQNFVHELLRTLAENGESLSVGIKWNRTADGGRQ